MNVKPLTPAATALLIVTFAAFGAQQIAVKMALADMAPITQACLRSLGGAALLGVWFALKRKNPFSAPSGPSSLLGLLFALDFGLLYVGIGQTSAAHATVLYYTAPMMIALAAMTFIGDEPFDRLKITGIALAFAGVAAISLGETPNSHSADVFGDMMCLLAAFAWAATVLVIRATDLRDIDPSVVLFHQLFGSVPLLAAASLAVDNGWVINWSLQLAGSLIFQTVAVAFLGYLVFFAMLQRHNASQVAAMSFLAPLFGVVFAVSFLGESQEPLFWAGATGIIGGLYVTNIRSA